MPEISALVRIRQEGHAFEGSLSNTVSSRAAWVIKQDGFRNKSINKRRSSVVIYAFSLS